DRRRLPVLRRTDRAPGAVSERAGGIRDVRDRRAWNRADARPADRDHIPRPPQQRALPRRPQPRRQRLVAARHGRGRRRRQRSSRRLLQRLLPGAQLLRQHRQLRTLAERAPARTRRGDHDRGRDRGRPRHLRRRPHRELMPRSIERHELQRLLAEQEAQLVEVLPADECADEHLPGAINIALKELDHETTGRRDRARAVIVYCYDDHWDVSPRAASRIESIGFEQVYDYTAGKADWGSFGLPLDGDADSSTRVGAHLRTDVPTCRLEDRLPELCRRLDESGWETCFVVDDEGVLLGRIGPAAIRGRQGVSAEEGLTPGPSPSKHTARSDAVAERMQG